MFFRIPRAAFGIIKEVSRHLLRRPVVGIAAACRTKDNEWLLIRRGDTGTWALPGGTLEWGETLERALARELEEEAGVTDVTFEKVVGVYSRPDRDPRFHAVTIVVRCTVGPVVKKPMNPLEIRDVKAFSPADVPHPLAMGSSEFLAAADAGGPAIFE